MYIHIWLRVCSRRGVFTDFRVVCLLKVEDWGGTLDFLSSQRWSFSNESRAAAAATCILRLSQFPATLRGRCIPVARRFLPRRSSRDRKRKIPGELPSRYWPPRAKQSCSCMWRRAVVSPMADCYKLLCCFLATSIFDTYREEGERNCRAWKSLIFILHRKVKRLEMNVYAETLRVECISALIKIKQRREIPFHWCSPSLKKKYILF